MRRLLLYSIILCHYITGITQNEVNQGVFQTSNVKPQNIVKVGSGHYFIDFGKDAFGALLLKLNETPHDSIIIHLGEKLSGDHSIDRNPGGTIRYQQVVLKDLPLNEIYQVSPAPDGRNDRYPAVMLPDSFGRIMPFRYCEIENLHVPNIDNQVSQKVFNYRFNDNASAFSSSDTVLNKIWDLCKHTIKATSFCGYYIDGDRERIPYEADAFINQLSHYAVDSEYTLAQRTNAYFIDQPTWPTEWILHTVLVFYYDYLYTGNTTFISKYYTDLKHKTLMPLAREDGLISTASPNMNKELMESVGFKVKYTGRPIEDIVDWPHAERDGYEFVAINTVVNAFYYENMRLMAEIAEVLGYHDDAKDFKIKATQVKKAINDKLFDENTGLYLDGEGSEHSSLHANMFPLAFGLVPEHKIDMVTSFIKSKGMACSVYGAQYLLEALYNAGEAEYALRLMNATEGDRNWWNMIRVGSTMTLEAWDAKYKPNLDWNHAWATAPLNIISRRMWGITPAEPGFTKVHIEPQIVSLDSSNIKVPTIKGAIYADYKKSDTKTIYSVTIPVGMTGEFVLPDGFKEINFNGKNITSETEVINLNEGLNRIEIENR